MLSFHFDIFHHIHIYCLWASQISYKSTSLGAISWVKYHYIRLFYGILKYINRKPVPTYLLTKQTKITWPILRTLYQHAASVVEKTAKIPVKWETKKMEDSQSPAVSVVKRQMVIRITLVDQATEIWELCLGNRQQFFHFVVEIENT